MSDLTVTELSALGMVVELGVAPNRIDVVTSITGVVFDDAWDGRVDSGYGDVPIHVIGLAELIQNKRALGRPQDLADVARLTRS